MIRKTRLFTPGPTPLLPAAQFAMAAADIHHRTAEFRALYQRVLDQLKTFVGTKNDVLLLASSGTGAMEASVSNLTSPGDRVLVLSAGKFGERWVALAKAFGCAVDVVNAPYGQTFSLDEVRKALKIETRAVFMQATESSTGVRHDVQGVAELLKKAESDALLVVDAITGLGTTHFDVDGWGVDVIIGGSQKAVMIPPGLAYLGVSERAWEAMEISLNPRYYFDLRKERKNAHKGESSYTPAVALIAGSGRGARLHRRAGGRRSGGGPRCSDRQCGEMRCDDARGGRGDGPEAVCTRCAGCRGDGSAAACRSGLGRDREGAEEPLRRGHHQRTGRDEGPDLPHGAHRLLRLHGHDCHRRRAGAGRGIDAEDSGLRVWTGAGCCAEGVRGAESLTKKPELAEARLRALTRSGEEVSTRPRQEE